MKPATVEIVAVGNEILAGDILDTNFQALARALRDVGAEIARHLTLPDQRSVIADGVRESIARADLVIVTGGLGPTADDVTRFGVADGLALPLVRDDAALETIRARFRKFGVGTMPAANEVQALFPQGAAILDNPNGTAAGFRVEVTGIRVEPARGAAVFVLPGPPAELIPMIGRHLIPWVTLRGGLPVVVTRRIRTLGIGESLLAETIAAWAATPHGVDIGYYPQDPGVDLKLTARGDTVAAAEAVVERAVADLRALLGDLVYSVEPVGDLRTHVAEVIGLTLRARAQQLAVAESCTGGLVASLVTAIAGSSDYFDGGVVVYANEAKTALAGVPADLIVRHGAVSEEVARALAEGIRDRRGVDWGIGLTGIAGPGGGSEEKPVGLVWIAIAGPSGTTTHRTRHAGARTTIQRRAAVTALDLLRRRLGS